MHILHIDCSPRPESHSRQLSAAIVEKLLEVAPATSISRRDLGADPLPHAAADYATTLSSPATLAAPLEGSLVRAEALIEEVEAADVIVIGTPMHNLTVPSVLKAWIDQILRAGPGDLVFIPRGNRHGFTNIGALPATLLTFIFPAGHEQFWIDNGDDPVPGGHPPAWGPDKLGEVAAELARHQVTVMPDRPDG